MGGHTVPAVRDRRKYNGTVIYLDYNATTPIAPEVAGAMRPFLTDGFGNPSSTHALGREARAAIDRARGQVAALIGAAPSEIVFTSGGTEASNAAIKGTVWSTPDEKRHIITSVVEHPATAEPCRFLERRGWRITRIGVDSTGRFDPDDVRRAIAQDTALITLMHAQNEVGTLEPLQEVGRIAQAAGIPLHTDAAQSLGKIPVRVDELGATYVSMAGHKLYAPKGVGAMYVRARSRFEPLMHGAGHEGGRRAGTENTLLIVGFGAACELAAAWLAEGGPARVRAMRDALHRRLTDSLGDRIQLNGHPELRLPNTLNVSVAGRLGADILNALDAVCASTGSACHAGEHRPSAVLTAMGLPAERALGAVRLSLGRGTTLDEVESAAQQFVRAVSR